mmetsp:Transcript_2777/g.10144  ORF Transcript_2777/g.10144 Transcript_2777/m.10144 type:complete len:248 (+) Transcript_2777:3810-4553(+)
MCTGRSRCTTWRSRHMPRRRTWRDCSNVLQCTKHLYASNRSNTPWRCRRAATRATLFPQRARRWRQRRNVILTLLLCSQQCNTTTTLRHSHTSHRRPNTNNHSTIPSTHHQGNTLNRSSTSTTTTNRSSNRTRASTSIRHSSRRGTSSNDMSLTTTSQVSTICSSTPRITTTNNGKKAGTATMPRVTRLRTNLVSGATAVTLAPSQLSLCPQERIMQSSNITIMSFNSSSSAAGRRWRRSFCRQIAT